MEVQRYTIDLLKEFAEKFNALLLEFPDDLNRDSRIKFKCECSNEDTRGFRNIFNKGMYCRKCVYSMASEQRNNTVKQVYGVDCVSQIDSVKTKRVETNMKKRGVPVPFQAKEVKDKSKLTNVKKYGV